MRDVNIAITAASYSGNKGAAAMLQSSINQLYDYYGERLNIRLMSVYPGEDREQLPFDFIRVVSCKPEQLLFIGFPLAVLHYLFRWCGPVCRLIEKNKIIRAYRDTDLVIDEAGISFVDSRGFVMNTYAFVCAAVPLLIGVPVVKYSQAMGPFHQSANRFLAKWILPKLSLICARGEITLSHLREIGMEKNVVLCADGAFTMRDDENYQKMVNQVCAEDSGFYDDQVVGLSLSSVVEKKCEKLKIDYKQVMVELIDWLNQNGYKVLLIANAARIHSTKRRNNDLQVCDAVYEAVKDKNQVRWYHKEMAAEEIREYIGRCRFLIASRFHAMIGALEKKTPVLLVGWSHKYQEVLDMFELGQYAIDFSQLNLEDLKKAFLLFTEKESWIRNQIEMNYDKVMRSSGGNIQNITKVIDATLEQRKGRRGLFDYTNPEKYMGNYLMCRKGYAADVKIRENCASGGVVTAMLCHMLKEKEIDGAWVTKSEIKEGKLGYHTYIATTEEEIRDAATSIYMDMPLLKHVDLVREFEGRLAVVLTPCMMRGFSAVLDKDVALKNKIVCKIGLFCSGNHTEKATLLPLKKLDIPLEKINRLYYRRGHWRGRSEVIFQDGHEQNFSYSKTICAYKNAYFFEKQRCMTCQNHFAEAADISVGDIWLKEMKKEDKKYTCCIIRTEAAKKFYEHAVRDGAVVDSHISSTDVIKGQKRALVFKFHCAGAKKAGLKKEGNKDSQSMDLSEKCKWNHRLAFYLAEKNRKYSEEHYDKLSRAPMRLVYYYMCFIRVLLSF